ncbi:hypothetical protein [Anaerobacillus arseniciselenatis]|uniref:hypothetical protein n=1 Tax=Anaerobacillus arseniciselenatis TaxID=85682 RepID=UPI0014712C45|nr:hypothetical protein [Anaerobacillus arseniciselenatis]
MNKFNLFVTFFTVLMLIIGCSSNQQLLENLNVTFENEGATMPTEFHKKPSHLLWRLFL